ncbi:hybrid sensor histidine kinase/response regulator [Fusibacter ferrireducens]|uniref:Stage 0 sporulation protein A homolog n=1 Tax=Fusibacter ferrireducens TaxID=2785058 RepID=A0ABR9ZYD2_9FIRM|nr:hybrid sensor histidine kinase/response regulator [Fusibacter ferrireducens]MBF4695470.1 response regulator [Fusibacter ferrireducens]
MDYSRLSRETLIHEIKQLNHQIEKLNIEKVGQEINIGSKLDMIQAPVFLIKLDYSVTWANAYSVHHYENILGRKCYQVFYDFNDICPGCPMQEVLDYKSKFDTMVYPNVESESVDKQVWKNQLIPLIVQGKVTGILEFQDNIRAHEQYDESYKEIIQNLKHENNELKRKVKKTNEFIDHFTREMRTPLRSLRGFFDLFDQTFLSELQKEYLKVIKTNSDLLFEILSRMLLYTKYDEGNIKIVKTEFHFRHAIEEVIQTFSILYENEKNNHIKLEYSPSIPDILIGDQVKLKLVISYLLETSNYLCQNDEIVVNVSEVTENREKIHLKISILDTSEVVPNRMIDLNDYDINTRSRFNTIEEYAIALGLYLSKELIQATGGMIEVSSVKDKGIHSTLFLTLDKVVVKSQMPKVIPKATRKKILIADHEKPQIPMDYFEAYDIYFAKTGAQAIELFFSVIPDLTIIDVMIEDCDGFSVLDEIERRKNGNSPVIAISNKLIDNEAEFMKDYGFDDYYTKPFTEAILKNIIENYLKETSL